MTLREALLSGLPYKRSGDDRWIRPSEFDEFKRFTIDEVIFDDYQTLKESTLRLEKASNEE